jgi:hypothetical protein
VLLDTVLAVPSLKLFQVKAGQKTKPWREDLSPEATIPKEFFSQGGEFTESSGIRRSIIEDIIPKIPNRFTHCIPNQC